MGKLTDEQKIEVVRLYKEGKNSVELGRIFGIDPTNILGLLRRRGVEMRTQSQATRTYTIDENVFDVVDAPEKAYWLGFLMADGSMSKWNNALLLEISNKDIMHIEKFLMFLKSNRPIYSTKKNCCKVCIGNKHLVETLKTHSIIVNKTMKTKTPETIPTQYISDFYRGFMDGDGWITHRNMRACKRDEKGIKKYHYTGNIGTEIGFCSGSEEMLIEIKKWINEQLNKDCGYLTHRKYKLGGQVWQLTFGGNGLCREIHGLLYGSEGTCLIRKKEKLEMLLKFSDEVTSKKLGKFTLQPPRFEL